MASSVVGFCVGGSNENAHRGIGTFIRGWVIGSNAGAEPKSFPLLGRFR
jgi:hypothetical protein